MALSNRDAVRHLIGDTDEDAFQLDNTEIEFHLDQRKLTVNGTTTYNLVAAAADAAGALAAKYACDYDFAEDDQTFSRSQRVRHFQALERRLRDRAGGASVPLRIAGTEAVT